MIKTTYIDETLKTCLGLKHFGEEEEADKLLNEIKRKLKCLHNNMTSADWYCRLCGATSDELELFNDY